MRDAPASRGAGILPALANEERKAGTLAALLFASRWQEGETPTPLDPPLARHFGKPAMTIRNQGKKTALAGFAREVESAKSPPRRENVLQIHGYAATFSA
jgi:hypothetical protein